MRIFAVCAVLVLSGCASLGGAFAVKVPVPIECREKMPTRPVMPTDSLQPGGSLFASTVRMQAEIDLREAYEGELRAALAACIAPVK